MIKELLSIGLGGGLGSIFRFLVQRAFINGQVTAFPTGTLAVNLIGCFAIGLLWGISEKMNLLTTEWKLFLLTGLCGGFTTFSAYSQESIALLKEGRFTLFIMYAGTTLLAGFLLTWLGYLLTK
jgi:CrcB protein